MGELSSGAQLRFPHTAFPPAGSIPMTDPQLRNMCARDGCAAALFLLLFFPPAP